MAWVIHNQMARRNITPEEMSYLRGKRYEAEKKEPHRPDKPDQNGQVKDGDTCDRLAEEYRVGRNTIQRDAKFAKAVDTIADELGASAKSSILSRDSKRA